MLLALSLAQESFARELARILETPLNSVQQALRGLEADGMVVGRTAGRTRLYSLNPAYFARAELALYLGRLSEPEGELRKRVSAIRRRPRRTGKPL